MKAKNFFLFFLFLAIVLTTEAQNKKIAILETVDKIGDVPYYILMHLRESLTAAISETPGYEGYSRVDIDKIMSEHNFQRTGLVSEEQIRTLGEMTGCSYILVAEAVISGKDEYLISAKILDVETGGVERAAEPRTTYKQNIQRSCKTLANELLGKETDGVLGWFSRGLSDPKTKDQVNSSNSNESNSQHNAQQSKEKPIEKPVQEETAKIETPSMPYQQNQVDGRITKQGKNYYLNGSIMSKDECFSFLQSNCPQAYSSYKKGVTLQTIGWITLGVGAVLCAAMPVVNSSTTGSSVTTKVELTGPVLALGSIPIIIFGSNRKNNAYKVYNQKCAGSTTALSFGPTTNGIGVFYNF